MHSIYRLFFNYSGAIFRHCQYIKDEGDFYSFYTIDELKFEYQFLRFSVEREMKIDCYEGHLLPIASTCFYNSYICFPVSSMFSKGVWLMDYNIDESSLPELNWKAKVSHISSSIEEFLTTCANNVLES